MMMKMKIRCYLTRNRNDRLSATTLLMIVIVVLYIAEVRQIDGQVDIIWK